MEFKGFINQRYAPFVADEQGGKKPLEKFSPIKTYTLDKIIEFKAMYGMKVPEGCVVVDSDTKEEGDIIIACLKEKNVKCLISKSTHGYHFYFRIPVSMNIKNQVDCSIPLGLVDIDYRSGQKTSFVIEYRDGKWADWVIAPKTKLDADKKEVYALDPYEDLDEIPYWLLPLKSNIITFRGFKEGDGRNTKLNALRTKLVCQENYSQQQVYELFELINKYVFNDPLPKAELTTVGTFRDIDRKQANERWFEDKHFLHNELGEYMINMLYCYKDERRRVWYFNDKYYAADDTVLQEKIVEIAPELNTKQRAEVVNYIHLAKIKSNVSPSVYHNWVCCNNLLVDGLTGNTIGHTPSIFITNKLEVEYDKDAYDKDVDTFLNEILVDKGDKQQRLIFEEYLGYTLFCRENNFKKMLLCIGPNANNGKSTMMAMIKSMLSTDNYSTAHLNEINERNIHMIPRLVDKIANFDDEAPVSLDDSAVTYLKTIISNKNEITVNPKYKEPFQTFINAKLWTNSNHIIKTPQKGEEWMTRLLILAFNNVFIGKNADPNILSRLTTENAKSYLLNLAIKGIQRLYKNGKFTESKESNKWLRQYRIENDSAYNFLFMKNYQLEQFVGKEMLLKTLYSEYKNDCEDNDLRPMSMNNFGKRFIEYFGNKVNIEIKNNNWVIKEIKEDEKK